MKIFELVLGSDVVKRVAFPGERGRRDLRSSGGYVIGRVVVRGDTIRLELDETAASTIAEAQFH